MILSLKGNRVIAEAQTNEESIMLLGLTQRVKIKHKKHKYKKECPDCHKKFKSVRIHARLKHGKIL